MCMQVMLEPMRHLHAEFPKYLATHKESLSPEELARYLPFTFPEPSTSPPRAFHEPSTSMNLP